MGTTTSVFLVYLLVLAGLAARFGDRNHVLRRLSILIILVIGLVLTIAFSRRRPCGIICR